jgi:drug/metabolite transporter (DMT)-like permease
MSTATPALTAEPPSAAHGRLLILLAAVLWSTSGAFTNFLVRPTALGLDEPRLSPAQMSAGRALFAGLVLVLLLRRRDLSFRPATALTALSFAAMNVMFIRAMALGSSANAILLQYTAPLWVFLAGVFFLHEKADRRGVVALIIGLAGIAVILAGSALGEPAAGQGGSQVEVILLGLGSGVTYAGVLLGLRAQRDASSIWLTVVNHLFSAVVLLPFVWSLGLPSLPQLCWLMLFGAFQMGLPYALMARGLRSVGAQEAATLTLLEPILNPLWAYLVAPDKENPTLFIFLGGALILGALAYRNWPARRAAALP